MRVAGAGEALTNFAARRLRVGGLSCTAITRTLATTPVTSLLHESLQIRSNLLYHNRTVKFL